MQTNLRGRDMITTQQREPCGELTYKVADGPRTKGFNSGSATVGDNAIFISPCQRHMPCATASSTGADPLLVLDAPLSSRQRNAAPREKTPSATARKPGNPGPSLPSTRLPYRSNGRVGARAAG